MKLIFIGLFVFFSCSVKPKLPSTLAGTYEVNIDLKQKSKEAIQSVKDSVKLALQKAKEEMNNAKVEMDLNVNNIDTSSAEGKIEYVTKSLVMQLSDSLSPNMGTLSEGIAELVSGTSNIGVSLVETMMKLVKINVTLNEDGSISSNQELIKAQFNTDMKWKQVDNSFVLLDFNGETNQSFTIQNRTETGFDLYNDEIILQFKKNNK